MDLLNQPEINEALKRIKDRQEDYKSRPLTEKDIKDVINDVMKGTKWLPPPFGTLRGIYYNPTLTTINGQMTQQDYDQITNPFGDKPEVGKDKEEPGKSQGKSW